jgi:predicted DNA-binding transcriptional regulator YafY
MADARLQRQFWTLTRLREGGVLAAQDIAHQHGVTLRTVYRDIEDLLAHGLPVRGVPGPEGGYRLEGGEELDPLVFRSPDSLGLYLRSPQDPARSETLWRKIEIASIVGGSGLEPEDKGLHEAVGSRIHFDKSDWYWRNEPPVALPELRRALFSDTAVRISYVERGGTEPHERLVLPYGLVWKGGSWYLVAAGADGRDISRYRLERIRAIHRTGQRFEHPAGFHLAAWWDEETHRFGQGDVRVQLEVSERSADEFLRLDLKENSEVVRNRDGSARVTLYVDRWEWLVPLVASYAGEVVVTEPDDLRRAVIDHFERGLRAFGARRPRRGRGYVNDDSRLRASHGRGEL